jgi:hypothetical protein
VTRENRTSFGKAGGKFKVGKRKGEKRFISAVGQLVRKVK